MSHSHVRGRVPRPPNKRNYWIEVAIWGVFVALACYWVQGRLWPDPVENSHETATGKVLETRVVAVGNRESNYGGFILYRVEAHVTYLSHGRPQDRWLPASEVTGDRTSIALQMAKQTGKCIVSWAPGHEENARCLLQ